MYVCLFVYTYISVSYSVGAVFTYTLNTQSIWRALKWNIDVIIEQRWKLVELFLEN